LSQRALELGASLRFATEVISAVEDADGVTSRLRSRDGGDISTVRAKYLIAADGARSQIRRRLGIAMQGHATFSKSITIYFRAERDLGAVDTGGAGGIENNVVGKVRSPVTRRNRFGSV
jgi:putative polyketide hydroxylase